MFHSLQHFVTNIHNFTKLKMLFPAVLIYFPSSKVYLIGNRSITSVNFAICRLYYYPRCFCSTL